MSLRNALIRVVWHFQLHVTHKNDTQTTEMYSFYVANKFISRKTTFHKNDDGLDLFAFAC